MHGSTQNIDSYYVRMCSYSLYLEFVQASSNKKSLDTFSGFVACSKICEYNLFRDSTVDSLSIVTCTYHACMCAVSHNLMALYVVIKFKSLPLQ